MTWDCGLILNPNRELLKIDSYPDAYFSGMYVNDKPTDPYCLKNFTGYVITFSYFPVLWQSQIQTETALLAVEA